VDVPNNFGSWQQAGIASLHRRACTHSPVESYDGFELVKLEPEEGYASNFIKTLEKMIYR
jgi:hypothetical protein